MILFRDCTLWNSKGRLSLLSVGCLCRASHTNWNSKIKKRQYSSRGHLFSHSWEYEYIMSRFSWKSSRTARDETVSMHFTYAQAFSWINTKRHKYACKLLILIRSHHSMTSEAVDGKKIIATFYFSRTLEKILYFLWRLEKVSYWISGQNDFRGEWRVACISFEQFVQRAKTPSLSLSGSAQDLRTWVCHPGLGKVTVKVS